MDLFFIFVIPILIWLATCIYTVPQRREALITSFGKHVYTEQLAGLKLKYPWPFNVVAVKIPTDLRQVNETLDTKTKDDLFVRLPITIQYEVRDTGRFYFDTDRPVDQMNKIVSAAVRKYTSGKQFQELYDERDQISQAVIDDVAHEVADYGIQIRRIVVDEPHAPKEVQDSFNRVRASEREKDAAENEAQADYIRRVKAAEADKERNILIGEGVAGFRSSIAQGYAAIRNSLVTDGVDPIFADRFMEEAMRLDTIRDVGDKGNMVIVVPQGPTNQNITDLLSASPILEKLAANKKI